MSRLAVRPRAMVLGGDQKVRKKMKTSALINTEIVDGFTVRFYTAPEDLDPVGQFHDPKDVEDIREGRITWFSAVVEASKLGIVLATEYLGGCAYKDPADFVRESGGYYDDMRDTVIRQAREVLRQLNEKHYVRGVPM